MTPAIMGGLLLIVGAYLTFKGEIFNSVFAYFLADVAWVVISYQNGDIPGTIMVVIGMLLGIAAFAKMHYGKMHKTIKKL